MHKFESKSFRSYTLLVIVILFTGFAYLNAGNDGRHGDVFQLVLLFITLATFLCAEKRPHNRIVFVLFWSFLGINLGSLFFPSYSRIDFGYFQIAFYRFFIGATLVYFVHRAGPFDKRILRWGMAILCLGFIIFSILDSYNIVSKTILSSFTPLPITSIRWNDKYHAFWLVFLTWASVGFLWRTNTVCSAFSVAILLLSYWALSLTSSESAQLAAIVSLGVFIAANFKSKRWHYEISVTIFLLMLMIPVIWLIFAPLEHLIPNYFLYDYSHSETVLQRVKLYDLCSYLIRKEFILGYGFGNGLYIPVPSEFQYPGLISNLLPGGHPHNIVFLFFLEHGLVGFLWLFAALLVLFNYIYLMIEGDRKGPAVFALLVSAQVIFSYSFDTYDSQVILLYVMFFVLLFSLCSGAKVQERKCSLTNAVSKFLVCLALVAIILHAADFYYFSRF